jgi:metal-sulfur cluster biosynthetic enzyme
MAAPLEDRVRAAIDEVKDPCSLAQAVPVGIAEMGMVTAVRLGEPRDDGRRDLDLVLRVTAPGCMYVPFMDSSIRAAVGELDELAEVNIEWDPDADWRPADIAGPARRRIQEARRARLASAARRRRRRTASTP